MVSFIRAPDMIPRCEHTGCFAIADRAPKIYCPPTGHRYPPVKLAFPHLHYCLKHWEEDVKLDVLLDDKAKTKIEDRGKKIWPQGIKPDFDAALVDHIDIFTPEFEKYMLRMGFKTDGMGFSWWRTMERRRA